MDLIVVNKGKVKSTKLQQKYFGVWPLRFSKKFKLNRLPADCDIFSYNGFQIIAKFRAGRICLPANTGNDNNNSIAVTKIAHTNKGNLCKLIPFVLIFITVVMKFIAPSKEETPAKCKLKIAKSTLPPE